MKFVNKMVFLVVLFHPALLYCQEKATVEISGKIDGAYSGKIYIFFEDNFKQKDSISSEIQDGSFYFTCDIPIPVLGRIHLGQTSYMEDFYIDQPRVYLGCSNKMSISNGGKDTLNQLSIDTVAGCKMEAYKVSFFSSLNIKTVTEIPETNASELYVKLNAFVRRHPKSKIAPYLISKSSHLSYEQLYSLYKNLDASLEGTYESKLVVKLLSWKERQSLGLLNEGMSFHNVSLTDINGKQVNTNVFTGKYFLIVCWASWCAPCRKENTILRTVFKKYKDKGLTMVGISYDNSTKQWTDAVRKDGLLWTQLIDREKFAGDFAKYYGIKSVPMTFLLDKDKKIVLAGSLEAILTKIEALIK